MIRYVLKRIIQMIPVLIGVSFLVFFLMSNARGDAAATIAGQDATIEEIEAVREEMGLNDPILVQYARYMGGVLTGDMGTSCLTRACWRPISPACPRPLSWLWPASS